LTEGSMQKAESRNSQQGKPMKSVAKSFRLTVLTFFILILNLILFTSPAFAQYFTINQFHSDVMIDEDS